MHPEWMGLGFMFLILKGKGCKEACLKLFPGPQRDGQLLPRPQHRHEDEPQQVRIVQYGDEGQNFF